AARPAPGATATAPAHDPVVPPAPPSSDETFDRGRGLLVAAMAERTGYPTEMLELDLDLEGDLGIDTVKQVEVMAVVRERLGLPREQGISIRDLSTLRKAVAQFVRRLESAGRAAEPMLPAPAPRAAPP